MNTIERQAQMCAAMGTLAWFAGSLMFGEYWLSLVIAFTAVPATIYNLRSFWRRPHMQKMRLVVLVLVVVGSVATIGCANTSGQQIVDQHSFQVPPTRSTPSYSIQQINGSGWAVPTGMDLNKYRVVGHPLTKTEQIELKLRLDRLPEDTALHNEDRKHHSFPVEVVKKRTEVWVDSDGTPVYKVDCGNRLMKPNDLTLCPNTVTCPSGMFNFGANPADQVQGTPVPNPPVTPQNPRIIPNASNTAPIVPTAGGNSLGDWFSGFVRTIARLGLGALLLALLLALLALLAYGLYRLITWMSDEINGRRPAPQRVAPPFLREDPQPDQPNPARQAAAVAAGPRPVAPPARPNQDAAPAGVGPAGDGLVWRRHGPYHIVNSTNAGRAGQHIIGYYADGRSEDLGVVTDFYTDDAGANGHHVWILGR